MSGFVKRIWSRSPCLFSNSILLSVPTHRLSWVSMNTTKMRWSTTCGLHAPRGLWGWRLLTLVSRTLKTAGDYRCSSLCGLCGSTPQCSVWISIQWYASSILESTTVGNVKTMQARITPIQCFYPKQRTISAYRRSLELQQNRLDEVQFTEIQLVG